MTNPTLLPQARLGSASADPEPAASFGRSQPLAAKLLFGLVLSGLATVVVAEETRLSEFVGKAYDADSGTLLYTEQHSLELVDGVPQQETVRYLTPDGDALAQKDMTYWQPARPAYRLTVVDPQRTETVEPEDSGVTIESVESGFLDWSDAGNYVIDGGFHYFILDHFDTLLAGESVELQFLAPTRTRWLGLRLRPVEQADGRLLLELNVRNRLLSLVISDIELTYDIQSQRLLRYAGLTNLPKPGGGNYIANIDYEYPGDEQP
ncbi:hypothetical protein [Saccharospirillum impatiens]|uniref:hypothetical protein n=1 Tax=Saccharospirillum impatiens TaxID=169438 RepID=UPI000419F3EE|nr:hypothetical protein [Saccharospirillum impatiens]